MDRRCLIVADDPDVLDALLRLAAAADMDALRAADAVDARRAWAGAAVVLLDRAGAVRCHDAGLPRRDGVVIAVAGEPAAADWRTAVVLGADRVVQLPQGEAGLAGLLDDARERAGATGRPGRVLAVVGGCGGAGASVLATAVAVTAARSGDALLVDCDPLGGGLDLLVGIEQEQGLRWPDLAVGDGRIRAAALHAALPTAGARGAALSVLSCARAAHGPEPAAVTAVLDSGRRAGGTVVCDLPRYPTDAALAAIGAAELTVLVVPSTLRGSAAAARVAELLAEHARVVELVVRGPAPGGLTPDEIAGSLGLPLLAAMRSERDLTAALERGRTPGTGRGPLTGAAGVVCARLSATGRDLRAAS